MDKQLFHINSNYTIAIWQAPADVQHYPDNYKFTTNELILANEIKTPKKLTEYFAQRALIKAVLNDSEIEIYKNQNGKPSLINTNKFISVSHAKEYIAIAINSEEEIGIDIEISTERILLLKDKFLTELEQNQIDITNHHQLTQCWCAKEALYKYYGEKELDFKDHIILTDIDLNDRMPMLTGTLVKNHFHKKIQIKFLNTKDYICAYTC